MSTLRQQMIDAMQVRGLAARTQEVYVDALARMARHQGRSPAAMEPGQIEAYMLHLSRDLGRSFSTINHVASASRFLFRHVLHREDRGWSHRWPGRHSDSRSCWGESRLRSCLRPAAIRR